MDYSVVIVVLLSAGIILLVWLLVNSYRDRRQEATPDMAAVIQLMKAELTTGQAEWFLSLREALDNAHRLLNDRLAESNRTLDERTAFMGEIENKLGQLAVQTKNIENIGQNIQSLSQLLRPPKIRGGVGEVLLDNLLAQILPAGLYMTQYRFSGGQRVDAVIKLGDKLLPIDAKFPLENYEKILAAPEDKTAQKDFSLSFKKHVDDICGKYLKPEEKTTDFTIMFIPSEAVYYQFISQGDSTGFEYALAKKVIPSSPGHLYGFLASISSVYTALNLQRTSLADGGRLLAVGLKNLADTLSSLKRLHERMEGSLRALSLSFNRARSETENLQYQLDKLQKPETDRETAGSDL
ncbi:MAG: DNA recombination protein RmuC [candidate division Zixibacteria bacterium]|nr:DNA recombination protein RmuC [candidate division Zixibacteria bacterium]MDD5426588.1 DNA recombination protein RmuC [candidate division Zixibacteria bacterium]